MVADTQENLRIEVQLAPSDCPTSHWSAFLLSKFKSGFAQSNNSSRGSPARQNH